MRSESKIKSVGVSECRNVGVNSVTPLLRYSVTILFSFFIPISAVAQKHKRENPKGEEATFSLYGGTDKVKLDFFFLEGVSHDAQQEYERAIESYQQVLKINPNLAAAHFCVAKDYLQLGRADRGISYAEKAVQLDKKNIWYRKLLSQLYGENNQPKLAIDNYRELLKDFPDQINMMYDLANLYLYTNQLLKAIEIYDEIERKTGVDQELSIQKQRIYTRLGKYDEAIAEVRKVITAFPDNLDNYVMLAELYLQKGDEEQALKIYNDILQKDYAHPYAILSLADYYRKKGDTKKSEEYLTRAIEEESVPLDAKVKIISALITQSDKDSTAIPKAKRYVKMMEKQYPDNVIMYSLLGDVYNNTAQKDSARYYYKKSLEKEVNNIQVWQQVLFIDLDSRQYADLKTDSDSALELFPNQTLFRFFNGISKYYLQDYEGAVKSYQSALRIGSPNSELMVQIYSSLGDTYHAMKDYSKSDEAFEKALDLNPNHATTLNNYAYYLSLRNEKIDYAEKMIKKAVELEPGVAAYLDTMGWVLFKKNKFEDAKTWIKKALDTGEASGEVHEHYGDILYKLGNKDGAMQYWKLAKEKGQNSEELQKKIDSGKLTE